MKAGADFVVLTMGVAISAAFTCSVLNKYFGPKLIYVTAVVTALLGGAWYILNGGGHENWALFSITLFAGSAYALVAALIENVTGFRFISTLAEQVIFVMVPPRRHSRFVDPHLAAQPCFARQLLQPRMQIACSIPRAGGPRCVGPSRPLGKQRRGAQMRAKGNPP